MKASLAAVVAVGVVSVVVVGLAGVFAGAGAGVYFAVAGLRASPEVEAIAPATAPVAALAVAAPEAPPVMLPPPAEVPAAEVPAAPVVRHQARSLRSQSEVDRSNAATDAAIRAQVERMRANAR